MNYFNSFKRKLYQVNDGSFADIALELFQYQAKENLLYSRFLAHLKIDPETITEIEQIPFLPVSFFKRHAIQTEGWKPEIIFSSSGTTGMNPSQHLVQDLEFYHKHAIKCFQEYFGSLQSYHILALLPSYLERKGSSLISMMHRFIQETGSPESGFFLRDKDRLVSTVEHLRQDNSGRKILLWGVTFALLELAENYALDLSNCLIMETGGMKGRRKEITRQEFYQVLRARLNAREIHSEYGMTEMMSQAYTLGNTRFQPNPFMKVLGRDLTDPMQKGIVGENAGINVIDLANFHSISFLETEDLGKVFSDGSFEILGRIDNADVRGCNLLV